MSSTIWPLKHILTPTSCSLSQRSRYNPITQLCLSIKRQPLDLDYVTHSVIEKPSHTVGWLCVYVCVCECAVWTHIQELRCPDCTRGLRDPRAGACVVWALQRSIQYVGVWSSSPSHSGDFVLILALLNKPAHTKVLLWLVPSLAWVALYDTNTHIHPDQHPEGRKVRELCF